MSSVLRPLIQGAWLVSVCAVTACAWSSLDGFSGGDEPAGGSGPDADSGTSPGIFCPKTRRCDVLSEVCCRTRGSAVTYACTAREECAPAGLDVVPLRCSSAVDCAAQGHPGATCCISRDSNGNPTDVQCVPLEKCAGTKKSMCDPVEPKCDRDGEVCSPSDPASATSGLSICR